MSRSWRRVVTGLDAEGKSCILIDGAIARPSSTSNLVWQTSLPADNSGSDDGEVAAGPSRLLAVFHRRVIRVLMRRADGSGTDGGHILAPEQKTLKRTTDRAILIVRTVVL